MRIALVTILLLGLSTPVLAQGVCCMTPDQGGTPDLPIICGAGYEGTITMVNGLPAGGTIQCLTTLEPLVLDNTYPGGTLGGTVSEWTGSLIFQMTGLGTLNGFNRYISVPVQVVTHAAPAPGGNYQVIAEEIFSLDGQLFGDPDFCGFTVSAGSNYAMPSPGQTVLSLSGNNWGTTGSFDISYTIDWVGCPGSIFDGYSGIDSGQAMHERCPGTVSTSDQTVGELKARFGQ